MYLPQIINCKECWKCRKVHVKCVIKIKWCIKKGFLNFLFKFFLKHTGHQRRWYPQRHTDTLHGHLCHQQGGWRSWTLWWYWHFCWGSRHSGQYRIYSPSLCNDAGSHLCAELGLPQRAEILLWIYSESALQNGWWKAFPQSPWTKKQDCGCTVGCFVCFFVLFFRC